MRLLFSLADARDIVVIVYGILGILFFFIGIIVALVLFFTIKGIAGSVRGLVNDQVTPTLNAVKETAQSIRGTTEFVSQTAVRPIIKTYGTVAGVRRGFSVLAGLRRRGG